MNKIDLAAKDPEEQALCALRDSGRIDEETFQRIRRAQARNGGRLVDILTALAILPERAMVEWLAGTLGLEIARPAGFPSEFLCAGRVSLHYLRDVRAFPIAERADALVFAVADPLDPSTKHALQLATRKPIELKVASAGDIEEAFNGLMPSQMAGFASDALDPTETDLVRLRESASDAPVVRFIERLIARAIEARASDIHLEPFDRRLQVRIRIDGVLREEEPSPYTLAAPAISRLKILSGLDIAERRMPQDGSMKLTVQGREIDFRVATAPIQDGEAAVIRILDRERTALDLATLGFDGKALTALNSWLARPNGILLVTGPTGSGKSTTLYACMKRLNASERKIISIEDPVENRIDGVNQIQVKPEIGLTFAHVLRSVLRHDPDIVFVGEIRDQETARIATQAALTGHLVIATLHTNSAAAAITRLLDMGVEDYLIASTVLGVVAQRLVRVLCPNCRQSTPTSESLEKEAASLKLTAGPEVWSAAGCEVCGRTGYRGRIAIHELFAMQETLRHHIVNRADSSTLHEAAVAAGMLPLRADGLRRVFLGATTLEEVARVSVEDS